MELIRDANDSERLQYLVVWHWVEETVATWRCVVMQALVIVKRASWVALREEVMLGQEVHGSDVDDLE